MRTLTDEHKAKLAAGRDARRRQREAHERVLISEYREWISLERSCYVALQRARMLGEGITEAREDYAAAWAMMPNLAPDSAYERERAA